MQRRRGWNTLPTIANLAAATDALKRAAERHIKAILGCDLASAQKSASGGKQSSGSI